MTHYAQNMLLLAKVEPIPGVDAGPTPDDDAVLLVDKVDITPLDLTYAQRKLLLPTLGASADLLAMVASKISFTVEASPSGEAGTSAPWGSLLLGCGTARLVLSNPARIETVPVSKNFKTLTLYLYDDGVLHKLVGSQGNAKFSAKIGETPKWQFDFIGAYVPVQVVSLPSATLTNWKTPIPVAMSNVVDITIGANYSAGSFNGGTSFSSRGLEFDFGNKTAFFASLSSERGELTSRESSCSYDLELSASQEVSVMSHMIENQLFSLAFQIGLAVGQKLIVFAPSIQRKSIKKTEQDGVRMLGFDCKVLPENGNDEWRFVQG